MKPADLLHSLLQKKWLSHNSLRDGLIACFTLALCDYTRGQSLADLMPGDGDLPENPDDEAVYSLVLERMREVFRSLGIDEEYPDRSQLQAVREAVEERLGFERLKEKLPELVAQYQQRSDLLFSKSDA